AVVLHDPGLRARRRERTVGGVAGWLPGTARRPRAPAAELAGGARRDHPGDRQRVSLLSRRRLPVALVLARVGAVHARVRRRHDGLLLLRLPVRLARHDTPATPRRGPPAA